MSVTASPTRSLTERLAASSAPVRIQLSRAKGWRMPPNTVKVDRSTRWGNPFVVTYPCAGQWDVLRRWPGARTVACGIASEKRARELAVEEYRTEAVSLPVHELRGMNLACWCKPGAACHADVLLKLANADTSEVSVEGPGIPNNSSQGRAIRERGSRREAQP